VGDAYIRNAGYLEAGELNNIIILFPQTIATGANPQACWDWWGYLNPLFRELNNKPKNHRVFSPEVKHMKSPPASLFPLRVLSSNVLHKLYFSENSAQISFAYKIVVSRWFCRRYNSCGVTSISLFDAWESP